jgi:chemotaxis protein MotA
VLKRLPGILKSVFTEKEYDYIALINQLCEWAGTARKQGIVALDKAKDEVTDPFLKRGLTLVVDSIEPDAVKDFLEADISQTMERHKQNAGIFDQAGAAAPTMGIIGTVLGLVVILAGLGNSSTAELGHGIATAFLATLMGVASANLVYIPFSTKLKNKSSKEILYREISTYGILAIQANESPIILKERLLSYLPDNLKAKGRGE